MVVSIFHFTHQIEIAGRNNHEAAILVAARRPALPPAWAAISLSLFSLKHFNLARGIRCDRALPHNDSASQVQRIMYTNGSKHIKNAAGVWETSGRRLQKMGMEAA